jgi:hypothetical protein
LPANTGFSGRIFVQHEEDEIFLQVLKFSSNPTANFSFTLQKRKGMSKTEFLRRAKDGKEKDKWPIFKGRLHILHSMHNLCKEISFVVNIFHFQTW